eukprot:CFRG4109T1
MSTANQTPASNGLDTYKTLVRSLICVTKAMPTLVADPAELTCANEYCVLVAESLDVLRRDIAHRAFECEKVLANLVGSLVETKQYETGRTIARHLLTMIHNSRANDMTKLVEVPPPITKDDSILITKLVLSSLVNLCACHVGVSTTQSFMEINDDFAEQCTLWVTHCHTLDSEVASRYAKNLHTLFTKAGIALFLGLSKLPSTELSVEKRRACSSKAVSMCVDSLRLHHLSEATSDECIVQHGSTLSNLCKIDQRSQSGCSQGAALSEYLEQTIPMICKLLSSTGPNSRIIELFIKHQSLLLTLGNHSKAHDTAKCLWRYVQKSTSTPIANTNIELGHLLSSGCSIRVAARLIPLVFHTGEPSESKNYDVAETVRTDLLKYLQHGLRQTVKGWADAGVELGGESLVDTAILLSHLIPTLTNVDNFGSTLTKSPIAATVLSAMVFSLEGLGDLLSSVHSYIVRPTTKGILTMRSAEKETRAKTMRMLEEAAYVTGKLFCALGKPSAIPRHLRQKLALGVSIYFTEDVCVRMQLDAFNRGLWLAQEQYKDVHVTAQTNGHAAIHADQHFDVNSVQSASSMNDKSITVPMQYQRHIRALLNLCEEGVLALAPILIPTFTPTPTSTSSSTSALSTNTHIPTPTFIDSPTMPTSTELSTPATTSRSTHTSINANTTAHSDMFRQGGSTFFNIGAKLYNTGHTAIAALFLTYGCRLLHIWCDGDADRINRLKLFKKCSVAADCWRLNGDHKKACEPLFLGLCSLDHDRLKHPLSIPYDLLENHLSERIAAFHGSGCLATLDMLLLQMHISQSIVVVLLGEEVRLLEHLTCQSKGSSDMSNIVTRLYEASVDRLVDLTGQLVESREEENHHIAQTLTHARALMAKCRLQITKEHTANAQQTQTTTPITSKLIETIIYKPARTQAHPGRTHPAIQTAEKALQCIGSISHCNRFEKKGSSFDFETYNPMTVRTNLGRCRGEVLDDLGAAYFLHAYTQWTLGEVSWGDTPNLVRDGMTDAMCAWGELLFHRLNKDDYKMNAPLCVDPMTTYDRLSQLVDVFVIENESFLHSCAVSLQVRLIETTISPQSKIPDYTSETDMRSHTDCVGVAGQAQNHRTQSFLAMADTFRRLGYIDLASPYQRGAALTLGTDRADVDLPVNINMDVDMDVGVKFAKADNNTNVYKRILVNVSDARLQRDAGQYKSSLAALEKAFEDMPNMQDDVPKSSYRISLPMLQAMANVKQLQSNIHLLQGRNTNQSLMLSLESLKMHRKCVLALQSTTPNHTTTSVSLTRINTHTSARTYAQERALVHTSSNYKINTIACVRELLTCILYTGAIYELQGSFREAEYYYKHGLQLARAHGLKGLALRLVLKRTDIANKRGDYSSASDLLDEATNILDQTPILKVGQDATYASTHMHEAGEDDLEHFDNIMDIDTDIPCETIRTLEKTVSNSQEQTRNHGNRDKVLITNKADGQTHAYTNHEREKDCFTGATGAPFPFPSTIFRARVDALFGMACVYMSCGDLLLKKDCNYAESLRSYQLAHDYLLEIKESRIDLAVTALEGATLKATATNSPKHTSFSPTHQSPCHTHENDLISNGKSCINNHEGTNMSKSKSMRGNIRRREDSARLHVRMSWARFLQIVSSSNNPSENENKNGCVGNCLDRNSGKRMGANEVINTDEDYRKCGVNSCCGIHESVNDILKSLRENVLLIRRGLARTEALYHLGVVSFWAGRRLENTREKAKTQSAMHSEPELQSGTLLSDAKQYMQAALRACQSLPAPFLQRKICHRLMQLCDSSDAHARFYYHNRSLAVMFQHKLKHQKLSKRSSTQNSGDACILDSVNRESVCSSYTSEDESDVSAQPSLSVISSSVMELANKTINQLPSQWTVCAITLTDADDVFENQSLCISLARANTSPLTLQFRPFNESEYSTVLEEFSHIMKEMYATMKNTEHIVTTDQKKDWWAKRTTLDTRLWALMSKMQSTWLGPWRGILLGQRRNHKLTDTIRLAGETLSRNIDEIFTHRRSNPVLCELLLDTMEYLSATEIEQALEYIVSGDMSRVSVDGGVDASEQEYVSPDSNVDVDISKENSRRTTRAGRKKTGVRKKEESIINTVPKRCARTRNTPVVAPTHDGILRSEYTQDMTNTKMSQVLGMVERMWTNLGLRRSRSQDNIGGLDLAVNQSRSTSTNENGIEYTRTLSEDRHHVVLLIDKTIQHLPWEALPVLRGQAVSRMSCLESITHAQNRYLHSDTVDDDDVEIDEHTNLNRNHERVCVDVTNSFYVVNPEKDLMSTEKTFASDFETVRKWEGVVGQRPTPDQILEALKTRDLYIYLGHGGGEKYLPRQKIEEISCRAVALLLGCSSGRLRTNGEFDPTGTPLSYILAGCPAALGLLWDVTDKDIDRFAQKLLSEWIDGPNNVSLAEAAASSRDVCKFGMLTGAAAVIYGERNPREMRFILKSHYAATIKEIEDATIRRLPTLID